MRNERLYDIKRGGKYTLQQDVSAAVIMTYMNGGLMTRRQTCPTSCKNRIFRNSKDVFEGRVGYRISNDRFRNLLYKAKKVGLIP